ncbi:MAG: M14 family metallocarboxypeptidase [Verrucomicrobiota bacterium]
MLPLGKNIGGYRGETIDIQSVLREMEVAALTHDWSRDAAAGPVELIAYRRLSASPRRRVYLSTGIHGDEPGGPLAMLRLLQENQWPEEVSLWICPCLNPTGFALNRRENQDGIDLNRDYRNPQSGEIRAHLEWLVRQPDFDQVLCLHEDWEARGFYLYELNPALLPPPAESIIDKVAAVCPVDLSPVIEGRPAQKGVIRPVINPMERPQWPESLYMMANHKTRRSCTLEAPSDFPLPTRVEALVAAVRAALAPTTAES